MIVCEELKGVGLYELQRRKEDRTLFETSHKETCTNNQKASVKMVLKFEELKHKVRAVQF